MAEKAVDQSVQLGSERERKKQKKKQDFKK
jgi:hypothetical protein